MSNKTEVTGGGIGLFGLVFIVFLILKLAEIGQVANWSWWWVTAPLWAPLLLVIGIFIVIGLIALVTILIAAIANR